MARGPTITLAFAGDASALQSTFGKVGESAGRMAGNVDESAAKMRTAAGTAGAGMDGLRDSVDTSEQRIIGMRDAITGTGDIMKGFKEGDLTLMLTGFADLASSAVNFVIPAIQRMGGQLLTTAGTAASSAASHVVQAGRVAAAWVLMGIQATLQAARMAAAWVVSLGPIVLLVAAVAGAVAAIIVHWDKIKGAAEAVWNFVSEKFNALVGFVTGLPGRISDAATGMWDGLKDSFKSAINWLISKWNDFEIKLPSFEGLKIAGRTIIPGFEGPTLRTPNIPLLRHAGGIVPGARGTEVPFMALAGERVTPMGRGGGTTVNVFVSGSVIAERDLGRAVADALRQNRLIGVT